MAKKYLGVDDIKLQSQSDIKIDENDAQNEIMKKKGSVKLTKNKVNEKKHKKCC